MSVDKLRSLTLGAPTKGRVETIMIDGTAFEIRAPTLKQQQTITRLATDKDGKLDTHKMAAQSLIACTWDPDEDTQVFGQKDLDTIMSFGTTGWVGQILKAMGRVSTHDPKEVEENFETTARD